MKNLSVIHFLFGFTLFLCLTACEKQALEDVVDTTVTEETNPYKNQEIVFLDPFPEVTIHCGYEDEKFYINESGKDQTVTVMGTDKCESGDSEVELQKEMTGNDGETKTIKVKGIIIPDGASKVVTWTLKDGEFLYFYCNGSDETGSCSWVVSVK